MRRFLLPYDKDMLALPDGPVLVLGAEFSPDLHDFETVQLVQTFKPEVDRLQAAGFTAQSKPDGTFATTMVLLGKHKAVNLNRIAAAWDHTSEGGTILMSGGKSDGVEAILKTLRREHAIDGVIPKFHGKLIWLTKTGKAPENLATWRAYAEPRENKDGYVTTAGVFHADKIDPGSALLSDSFTPDIKGRVADLGAGWGYLAHRLLQIAPKIDTLDLHEADQNALACARLNVTDPRAQFHWSDVAQLGSMGRVYDTIVSNPPFHQTQKSEPALGQAFIATAAKILRPKGRLLIVANRQLAYENTLASHFRTSEKLVETNAYKVLVARNPR